MRYASYAAVALVLCFTCPISAISADKGNGLSSQDKQFVTKAMQAGHAEVAAGKVAASKGENADIRKFGEQMVQDHSKAGDELMRIAGTKGAKIPAEADFVHKGFIKRLEKLKGKQFDRAYIREAGIKDHKAAVDLFTKEAKRGNDGELKAFAEKTLPTIQQHFQMAQNLSESLSRKK